MSTRGAIARVEGDGFKGVYHHWDSYPSGLGATLWHLYHGHFKKDTEAMLKVLIDDHPAGWSTLNDGDFAQTPGFIDSSNEICSRCGKPDRLHWSQNYKSLGLKLPPGAAKRREQGDYAALGHSTERSDQKKRPQCYCHGDRKEEGSGVTHLNAAGIGVEYVYAFDGHTMLVLSSYTEEGKKMIGMFGMGDPKARWRIMARVDLDGPEPDWEHLAQESAVA